MDLRRCFKDTIDTLQRVEQQQAEEKQRLLEGAASLEKQRKELQTAVKQLESDQRSVQDIKDVKAQREENAQERKSLDALGAELKRKELELKKKENELYEIKTRQDETDKNLRVRESELSHREKTYKEELEKNFVLNFRDKLLNK